MAEGSMRENLDKAAYYRPSNLTAIIDVNRLGQRGPTKLEADMAAYQHSASQSPLYPRLHKRVVGNLGPRADQRVPELVAGDLPGTPFPVRATGRSGGRGHRLAVPTR
jgi:hypothetical protein